MLRPEPGLFFIFQARKDDAEKKRLEALDKKKEREALLAEEAEKEKGKQVRKLQRVMQVDRSK